MVAAARQGIPTPKQGAADGMETGQLRGCEELFSGSKNAPTPVESDFVCLLLPRQCLGQGHLAAQQVRMGRSTMRVMNGSSNTLDLLMC